MDDFVDTKLCVKCGGEKSGTYVDRKSLFVSKPGTLSSNIFPTFHLDGWVLEKFKTRQM